MLIRQVATNALSPVSQKQVDNIQVVTRPGSRITHCTWGQKKYSPSERNRVKKQHICKIRIQFECPCASPVLVWFDFSENAKFFYRYLKVATWEKLIKGCPFSFRTARRFHILLQAARACLTAVPSIVSVTSNWWVNRSSASR